MMNISFLFSIYTSKGCGVGDFTWYGIEVAHSMKNGTSQDAN